jgi:hypothetical protein
MTSLGRQRGQILILLGTWLLLGGGASSALVVYDPSTSDMQKAVEQVIAGDRREAILAAIDAWQSRQERRDGAVNTYREELLQAMRRKETPRSEVEPTLARLDVNFVEMDRDFLDLRFRVKDQVTRAEWVEILSRGGALR